MWNRLLWRIKMRKLQKRKREMWIRHKAFKEYVLKIMKRRAAAND